MCQTRQVLFVAAGLLLASRPGAAGADGITLTARDAVIHGKGARYESRVGRQCIAQWSDETTWLSWEIDVTGAGHVMVEATLAATKDAAGSTFVVEIGDARIDATVKATKDWTDFVAIGAGELDVAKTGAISVAIRPTRKAKKGEPIMNLRSVTLRGDKFAATLRKWRDPEPPGTTQLIGGGIARFYPRGLEPKDAAPSLALEREPAVMGQAPGDWRDAPKFGISNGVFASWAGSVAYLGAQELHTAHLRTEPGASLYGTGEIAGRLLRNGSVSICWNTDAYSYSDQTKSLYQSHPWVLAVRRDGSSFGVLADTTWQCEIDLTDGIRFSTDGPPFAVIVIEGRSPQEVLQRLSGLTGHMPLPPLWAVGYQQCRYSYFPDARVREIADGFRSRKIPCDVIWMDIDYMNGFRIFTFDPKGFPDPTKLNADLHARGFKSVWMIDPGAKIEKKYKVYDEGTAGDHWIKTAAGKDYQGKVWPGWCVFPDFTRPETRKWWAGLYKDFLSTGVDGVWNDMNEPAVFQGETAGTMPPDNRHRGGDGLPPGPHARYHNVFGMLMVRATRDGIQAAHPDRRPFVLTRANYIGGQRYAATWTGDNISNQEHLNYSIPMILNLGLSGQPFCGPDIGGFGSNGDGPLFARWMGIGALFPFSRGHSSKGTRNKEPWAFGNEVEQTCRLSLERRYRLLPYLYTLFHESSLSGLPVARPVFFADAADPGLREVDDAFLLGSDLLVQAVVDPKTKSPPKEPKGIWRAVTLVGENSADDPSLPVLKIRGGSIIPLGRVVQSTAEKSLDPLTLLVCLDEQGKARGTLYEDAGDGYGYREGQYLFTEYTAIREGGRVAVRIATSEGKMERPKRDCVVEVIEEQSVRKATGSEVREISIGN